MEEQTGRPVPAPVQGNEKDSTQQGCGEEATECTLRGWRGEHVPGESRAGQCDHSRESKGTATSGAWGEGLEYASLAGTS